MRLVWRLALASLVVLALVSLWLVRRGPQIESGSVLVVRLAGEYEEASRVVSVLSRSPHPALPRLLSELAKAERDERLAAVVLRIGSLDMGWGKAQELRDAIERLREAGKRPIAYIEVESLNAGREYYVATAAEKVYVARGANAPLIGLAAEYLFLGGLWDKLGIELEVERIGRYKSFADDLTATEMSGPYREMATALLDSIDAQFIEAIGSRRSLTPQEVRQAIDGAPMDAEELEAARLIDGVAFWDEVIEELGEPTLIDLPDYARVDPASVGFDPVAEFALVHATGPVVLGEGAVGPTGGSVISAVDLSDALTSAAEDPRFAAIVLRVDSGGGSALASDVIWRALREAREHKPVVVSLSDVAASGGYYLASSANAIVAHPGSITGSIGVLMLRPNLGGLLERLGVGYASLTRGRHADILLTAQALSPETRERLADSVAGTYHRFLARVSEGRKMEPEAVDAVGQGRVWTGAQALERGLVDELGGLRTAVLRTKREVGLEPGDDVALVPYPPERPLLLRLLEMVSQVGASARPGREAAALQSLALEVLPREARRLLASLAQLPGDGPVLLPPVWVDVR